MLKCRYALGLMLAAAPVFAEGPRCRTTPHAPDVLGSIDVTCKNPRKISKVRSLSALEEALCSTAGDSPLSADVFHRIDELRKSKSPNPLDDSQLKARLERLAFRLNDASGQAVIASQNNPLSARLEAFLTKFKNPQARDQNRQEYLTEARALLGKTVDGREVEKCYLSPPTGFGADVFVMIGSQEISRYPGLKYVDMEFSIKRAPGRLPHRQVLFNTSIPPEDAISMLGHEMFHGCSAALYDDYEQRLSGNYAAVVAESDRDHLIGEVKAYSTQARIFAELARARPVEFCSPRFVSRLSGPQILSSGEYNAFLENSARDGTLPLTIAEYYSLAGKFRPGSIFANDPVTHQAMLYPHVAAALRQQGLAVR